MNTKYKVKDTILEIKGKLAEFKPITEGLTRARNPFELRYFVVGRHDDRIQQYKQAVIEMDAKYKAIEEALYGIQFRRLDKEEKLLEVVDNPKSRKDEIKNKKIMLEVNRIDKEEKDSAVYIAGAYKELMDFIHIIENEYSDLIDKTEEELLEFEFEYWKKRIAKQIHIDLVTTGRITAGNLSVLESMPKEAQEEILILSGERNEEFKQFENNISKKLQLKLSQSYPHPTSYTAPPDYIPLKLRKDAPVDYPEDRIVNKDRVEIMIATLHRPNDKVWLSEEFYIPTGKNYIKHWIECPSEDLIGEYADRLVIDALSLGCTHIFFVDDDLKVSNDALQKLYAHNLDIVGGWYPKKTPVIESATMVKDTNTCNPVPLNSTGLIKIDWALTRGLTLIKTDVFRKVKYPWFLTTEKGTEDTYFTQRAIEAGYKVWLDTSIKAFHIDKNNGDIYSFDGIVPKTMQVKEEFDELLKYVKGKKLILEIGTSRGGTLYHFLAQADDNAEIVSIDKPNGAFGGEFGQPHESVMQSWKKPDQKLHIIRDDSTGFRTIRKVREILNGRKFDFTFIDGDHSYEGVKSDYEIYKELSEGLIAFHDIVEHNRKDVGVPRFWRELKGEKLEFIKDPNQGWAGIGIMIYNGKETNKEYKFH